MKTFFCAIFCMALSIIAFSRQQVIPVYNLIQYQADSSQMRLSEIADSIYYLTLRTPEGVALSNNLKLKIGKKYILVGDQETKDLYLFNKSGEYITLIGNQHPVPDFSSIHFACALNEKDGEILATNEYNNRLYAYDLQGRQLRYFSIKSMPEEIYQRNDMLTFFYCNQPDGSLSFQIKNLHGAPRGHRSRINNQYAGEELSRFRTWQFGDSLIAWCNTSDSIYNISSNGNPSPRFVINSRKTNTSEQYHGNGYSFIAIHDSMTVDAVLESKDHIFVDAMYKLERRFMVCRKDHTKTFNLVYNLDVIDHGLVNDLDGGPPFLPERQMNEQIFYSVIQKERFLKAYHDPYTKSITAKNNAMQKVLKTFVESLIPEDRLVIQVAVFKH